LKIVDVDENIIQKLRSSRLSNKMKSLEYCKFLVIEEQEGQIIGASGIGGLLNVHSIQLAENVQGKGLGKTLFEKNIEEAKKRGLSYILVSRDPKNGKIIKLHSLLGFKPLFRIHYSEDRTSEALILVLKSKGEIVAKSLKFFNNIFGMSLLAIILKVSKSSLFKKFLTYSPEEFPDPSIKKYYNTF